MRHWWFRGLALTFALSVLGWHVVTAAGCEKQSPPAPYLPVRMMMPPKPGETPQQGATPSVTPSATAAAAETAPKKPCKPAYFPATKAAPVFHDDQVPCVDDAPANGNGVTQGVVTPGNAR